MVDQISIFLENRPGRLKAITNILRDNAVNIRASVIQDRGDFGIMKLLVNDPVRAQLALSAAGLAAAFRPVIAVRIADRPGGLFDMACVLEQHGINIADAYGFVISSGQSAVFCVEVKEPEQAEAVLKNQGFELLSGEQLYRL